MVFTLLPCWCTKTKDLSLAPFVRPPAIVHNTIVICVSVETGCKPSILLYIVVTSSILIGYKHAANSCLLCFSYVIPTNNRFYICRIDVIPTDNSFMHAEVTSRNTLTSSFISFVMAGCSSGICIIKQLLNSVFAR